MRAQNLILSTEKVTEFARILLVDVLAILFLLNGECLLVIIHIIYNYAIMQKPIFWTESKCSRFV